MSAYEITRSWFVVEVGLNKMGKCVGGTLKGMISCFNKQNGHQIDTRMIKIGNDFKNYFELNHTIYKINRQKQLHYRSNPVRKFACPGYTHRPRCHKSNHGMCLPWMPYSTDKSLSVSGCLVPVDKVLKTSETRGISELLM